MKRSADLKEHNLLQNISKTQGGRILLNLLLMKVVWESKRWTEPSRQNYMNQSLHLRIVSNLTPSQKYLLTPPAYFTTLQFSVEYAPDMDSWLRKTIKKSLNSKKAAKSVADYIAKKNVFQCYLMQTSQATDLI
jgi:hypothetical protein